jgi:hypothetical protein
MKALFCVTAAFVLAAGNAFAQIDPDPNGIGIYFDQAATQAVTTATLPGEIHGYLVATHCTLSGQVRYWEGGVVSGDFDWFVGGAPVVGQNLAENMPGSNSHAFQVLIDPATPFPVAPVLVLADLLVYMYTPGPHWLYVRGFYLSAGGADTFLYPSSGSEQRPVAVVNGEMPVRVESSSWGAVKNLYSR